MKHALILAGLLTSAMVLQAQQKTDGVVQEKFASGGTVRLHLEAGDYTIRPSESESIVVTYAGDRESQMSKVKVRIRTMASRAEIHVENTPRGNFHATIEVPRRSNLWARMSAGELDIGNVEGDKDIEMWAGQLSIEVPEPDAYGHRDASVGAGSLEASAFNISKDGLFRSFSESGPGKYRLHARVTTGEIDVR